MPSIFTRIINREIPANIIYEDDICIAILDINPIQKGHTIIIPKQELPWMDEYSNETISHCMCIAKKLMIHMKTVLSDIHFVYLMVEGIEVPHRHIHLVPYPHASDYPQFSHVQYDEGETNQYHTLLQTDLS